ncbi:hypothetical protein LEP1GSC059_2720 [Leptospira noguchii serovar Panama str. CZ214]|uniref:Uncharacterized protein n=1 Tax=Leptospira noguchii serovar Panama str. CZ214 TaxID=1001595 RepID=T0FDQ0_9LEPT|nr:hypothetical protein LEP1GSC059_2720 [Leptospira noguchii serovar Panama str. CZ214]
MGPENVAKQNSVLRHIINSFFLSAKFLESILKITYINY